MKFSLSDTETFYHAILNRDNNFEGIFVVGIKTTGIFCRSTCTAKKPKFENIEFFETAREALLRGYRPCRICNPLEYKGEFPTWLEPLMNDIDATPGIRLRDADLRARGLEPNRVRRWFKSHLGMSFQMYLRSMRIGQAFGRIKYGEKVIDSAFEAGYESLSGFTDSFKKIVGFSPNQSSGCKIITITRILSPLGPFMAGATDDGICLLEFIDRRMLETQMNRLKKLLKAEMVPGVNRHFNALSTQLEEYFTGSRKVFEIPLVMAGTPFQRKVWDCLQTIPYGETRSYQEQAKALGEPNAVRAVAKANGDNPIAIIVPCHRVIGKNGELVGYGGGLNRKQFLLDLELRNKNSQRH